MELWGTVMVIANKLSVDELCHYCSGFVYELSIISGLFQESDPVGVCA